MKYAYKSAVKIIKLRILRIYIWIFQFKKWKTLCWLLKCYVCLIGKDNQHQGSYSDGAQMNGIQPEEIGRLREEIEELKSNRELLQSQLAEKDFLIENLVSEC